MDHSYRAALAGGGNGARLGRSRPGFAPNYPQPEPEPLPVREDATPRIFAFVDELFFQAKIQETARKLNVKVEFLKTEQDLSDRLKQNGDEKPSLIIFDLNSSSVKPLTLIPKLKTKLKKGTSIIGFLSHVREIRGSVTALGALEEIGARLIGLSGPLHIAGRFGHWFPDSLTVLGFVGFAAILFTALAPIALRGGGTDPERDGGASSSYPATSWSAVPQQPDPDWGGRHLWARFRRFDLTEHQIG